MSNTQEQQLGTLPVGDSSLLLSPEDLVAKQAKWQAEGYTETEAEEMTQMLQRLSEIQALEKDFFAKGNEYWKEHLDELRETERGYEEEREAIGLKRDKIKKALAEREIIAQEEANLLAGVERGFYEACKTLPRLPDKVIERLVQKVGSGTMNLSNLKELSAQAAKYLGRFKGALGLGGLTDLPDQVAENLSKQEGTLFLDGLYKLSPMAAAHLSKHSGGLNLNGLRDLSDQVFKNLVSHRQNCSLAMNGIITLSDQAAEYLSKHQGMINLGGLKNISDQAAKSLAEFGFSLLVPPDIAEQIKRFKKK